MDSVIVFNAVLTFSFFIGVAVSIMTFTLVMQVMVLRILSFFQIRRTERFTEKWRPIFLHYVVGEKVDVPDLSWHDVKRFLRLWLHYQDLLRGEAQTGLNDIAEQVRLSEWAHWLMQQKSVRKRVLAISALGYLKEKGVWGELTKVAASDHVLLSMVAARALLHIDAKRALTELMPMIIQRTDWSEDKMVMLMGEVDKTLLTEPLLEMVPQYLHTTLELTRIVQFFGLIPSAEVSKMIHEIVDSSPDDKVISSCLQVVGSAGENDLVRRFIRHPRWHIRVQAAKALGRIGFKDDLKILVMMLSDREWWVRYRAAQSIMNFPGRTRENIEELHDSLDDKFARDILTHVLAERRVAA